MIGETEIETSKPLVNSYLGGDQVEIPTYVSLYGTPLKFLSVSSGNLARKILLIESWNEIVPGDILLLSPTPDVLETLAEYPVTRASSLGTRAGSGIEPDTIYRYEIEVSTSSGYIPFVPSMGMLGYLKAQPLYSRGDFGVGDIKIPAEVGPCLLDYFAGGLLHSYKVQTKFGIKTWDSFGEQQNLALTGNQQWQVIPSNYVLLERPIRSDSFLFWQRITGKFQLLKKGFFQAELDSSGRFTMSSDLLVPKWPTDRQHGWVIPIISHAPVKISVQFEPQGYQVFDVPGNELTFLRPKLLVDPERKPIDRIVFAIEGPPNSRVEIRTWEYDGRAVSSLSYFLLGTLGAFGMDRWMAGGFCLKPLFYNTDILNARYSDGIARYNSGYIYV